MTVEIKNKRTKTVMIGESGYYTEGKMDNKKYEGLTAAEIMNALNESNTSEINQDWDAGTTTYVFEDGSQIVVSGNEVFFTQMTIPEVR